MRVIIIHYGEIGTKGKNREIFEKKLIKNVKLALGKKAKVYRRYGRIVCQTEISLARVKNVLEKLPGIANFSIGLSCSLDMEEIKKKSLSILTGKFKTFKVIAKRSNKLFPLTSMEINRELGTYLVEKLGKEVDLKTPERVLWVEVCEKEVFLYTEKFKGIGGLPTSTSGKVVALLSGGIDSPVASFLMMKRGCRVIFIHFFNQTISTQASLAKVKRIVEKLTQFQLSSKLYLVPFGKLQAEIIKNIQASYRMIIYRRFMMKIANLIAKKENAKAIVTGDSVGQVASQTLENLSCVYDVCSLPVFSPLIGMNKEETVRLAKEIGTYELSILPYPDCCSFMVAKHPKTKTKPKRVVKLEERIEQRERLIKEALSGSRLIRLFPPKNSPSHEQLWDYKKTQACNSKNVR